MDVEFAIAREAARVRAASGLGMPDALVVASALVAGAPLIATNDPRWPGAITGLGLPLQVVELGRFVTGEPA